MASHEAITRLFHSAQIDAIIEDFVDDVIGCLSESSPTTLMLYAGTMDMGEIRSQILTETTADLIEQTTHLVNNDLCDALITFTESPGYEKLVTFLEQLNTTLKEVLMNKFEPYGKISFEEEEEDEDIEGYRLLS